MLKDTNVKRSERRHRLSSVRHLLSLLCGEDAGGDVDTVVIPVFSEEVDDANEEDEEEEEEEGA